MLRYLWPFDREVFTVVNIVLLLQPLEYLKFSS